MSANIELLGEMALPVYRPQLSASFNGVRVGLTLRGPGSGRGFNMAQHVGDDPEQVQHRRNCLQAWLGAPVVWLDQVHGVDVLHAEGWSNCAGQVPPVADASFCVTDAQALAVLTADCLPVVMVARQHEQALAVAVAHAGWRGLCAGVLENCAVQLANCVRLNLSQVHAWLGPAIGPASFEVGPPVRDAFLGADPSTQSSFVASGLPDKWLGDLYALAAKRLMQLGLGGVEGAGFDTVTDLRWHSHRRSLAMGQPAGRFATVVRLEAAPAF